MPNFAIRPLSITLLEERLKHSQSYIKEIQKEYFYYFQIKTDGHKFECVFILS